MNKLNDLMIMALKYQTFHCHNPNEMFLVLLNHFVDLSKLYSDISYEYQLRVKTYFIQKIEPIFINFKLFQWIKLRRQILNDYQVLDND